MSEQPPEKLANADTQSEVEQLRQNQKEALAYAQKRYFPGARLR